MKKKFRKLILSKETLKRLDEEWMARVAGGSVITCTTRGPITHCDNCGPEDTSYCTWGPGNLC